jgi:hypothetical protein
LLTLLLAGGLSACAIGISLRALARCRSLSQAARLPGSDAELDELERRLAEREATLELGLSTRNVLALGRASLFGGTGCAVWELTGGSAHYLLAGGAFGLGLAGWAGCGEVHRRVGYLAGSRRALRNSKR